MSDFGRLTDYLGDPYFGLTPIEAKLLRWSMQGVGYRPGIFPDDIRADLATGVWEARESFLAMQRDFGGDPGDLNAPADRQFEYSDLVEKLQHMAPAKATQLYLFMVGYLTAWEWDDDETPR